MKMSLGYVEGIRSTSHTLRRAKISKFCGLLLWGMPASLRESFLLEKLVIGGTWYNTRQGEGI